MAVVESSIEGPVASILPDPSGTGADVLAMGITVRFLPGQTASGRTRTIKTPSQTISIAQLLATDAFPGRSQSGFVAGTIIAEGEFDTDTGILIADFINVEPAESVLLGALTQNSAGTPRQLRINGVPVVMLQDSRLSSNPDDPTTALYVNQYGFPMKIETATLSPQGPTPNPPPAPTSAEGYFASNVFHAFLFEFGGTGTLLNDPAVVPQISIERASYRDEVTRVRFEARGFVTSTHAAGAIQNVELFRVDFNPATGQMQETPIDSASVEAVETGFQRWRMEFRDNKPGGFLSSAPLKIIARNTSVPVSAETEPDIREP